jgi:hypothetical protein
LPCVGDDLVDDVAERPPEDAEWVKNLDKTRNNKPVGDGKKSVGDSQIQNHLVPREIIEDGTKGGKQGGLQVELERGACTVVADFPALEECRQEQERTLGESDVPVSECVLQVVNARRGLDEIRNGDGQLK